MRHDDVAAVTDDKLTETTIMMWLKGAPDLGGGRKKRQEKSRDRRQAAKKLLLDVTNSADESTFDSGRPPLPNLAAAGEPSASNTQAE